MRISPVSYNFIQKPDYKSRNTCPYHTMPMATDTFTFTGGMTGKEFKRIAGSYMPCLYTGEKMLTSQQLAKMKKRGFFTGPIKDVVKKLQPYKDKYLEPVERQVFEKIEEAAKVTPDIDMPHLFKDLYKSSRSKIRTQQKPSFDKIKTLGAKLPQEYYERFYKFMEETDRRLYDEPILQSFSMKEFDYKISKILEKMSDPNLKNRIQRQMDILKNEDFDNKSKPLLPQIVKNAFNFINLKTPCKKSTYYEKHLKPYEWEKDAVKIKIIEKIKLAAQQNGYKKLERLCSDNIDMINGIPVRVPFSNKSFVYNLDKVLEGMPDEQLKKEMLQVAQNLPTSNKSPEALILKLSDADPNVIGDRLFNPSLVSIEHMHPDSLGGSDLMVNCALAKKWINSQRGNEPMWLTLSQFDQQNPKKYAESLIRLNHKGKVSFEDAMGHLETIEREGHINLEAFKSKLKVVES